MPHKCKSTSLVEIHLKSALLEAISACLDELQNTSKCTLLCASLGTVLRNTSMLLIPKYTKVL